LIFAFYLLKFVASPSFNSRYSMSLSTTSLHVFLDVFVGCV